MTIRAAFVFTVTAVLLTAWAPAVSAQIDQLKETTPEQRAQLQTEFIKSKLGLAAEETRAVADINLKYAKKMDPIIKGSAGPFMKIRLMREINQAKEAELKTTLTPQQFEKYQAAREEMREKLEEKIEGDRQ